MAPMEVIWLFLVKMWPLLTTLWLLTCPPPSYPIGMLVVLTTSVKKYLKWLEIQLAIQCTVDTVNSYRFVEKHMQAALIILEIY